MMNCYRKVVCAALFCGLLLFCSGIVLSQEEVEIKENQPQGKETLSKDVEQLDFANGLFERGLFKMADKEYEKFINLYPESDLRIEAYYGAPESLFFDKSYKKAIEKFKRYREFFPDDNKNNIAVLRIGQAYFLAGNLEEAINTLHSVDDSKLTDNFKQTLYYYLGKAYRDKGDKARSIESYNKATQVPNDSKYVTQSYFDMGEIYSQDSNFSEAIEVYNKAHDSAVLDKSKVQALFKKGEMSFLSKDYETSISDFRNIIEQFSDDDIAKDAFSNLISSLYNASKYEEILIEYKKHSDLIAKGNNASEIMLMTARAYLQLGLYEEVIGILDEMLSDKKIDKEKERQGVLVKAEALVRSEMYQEAIVLIRSNPFLLSDKDSEILFWRAESTYGLKQYEEAYELYKRIIEEYPDSLYSDDALYSIAFTNKFMGNEQEAKDLFHKYYEQGKNEGRREEALYNGILLKVKLALIDEVLSDGETYLSKYSQGGQIEKVLYLLGTLYTEKEDHQNAVRILGQYELGQKDSKRIRDVYFLLAHNFQMMGDLDGSLKYYDLLRAEGAKDELVYPSLKNSALIFSNMKRFDDAAAVFERIINDFEKNDLDIDVYIWLAQQRMKEKKYDDVINILERSSGSKGAEEKQAIVAYYTADAYKEKGEFPKAIENYDIVLLKEEFDEYKGAAHIGKGYSLREIKDHDAAKKEFEAAITENPDDNTITMKARFELASTERIMGNLEQASKLYLLVGVLYDDAKYCSNALYSAGELFEEMGSKEEAVKVYSEVVEKYVDSEFYAKAQERLKALSEG
ncbi:MAG: tetratricopeptide repeat protein [Candidatus Omnitrophica bacterium]|nr:tetratricopeptide repeat protein [Candidatus Omnitrophota bacterium]